VTSEEEMRGFVFEVGNGNDEVREHLAARIGGYGIGAGELEENSWQSECDAVFPEFGSDGIMITFDLITEAIGTYERSQVFVDTPWKAYIEGDRDAISLEAKEGALLFFRSVEQGGGGCASCHSGDFFTDEQYYALAIPQIGHGKGDGPAGDDDFGRYRETLDPKDLYAFRTPTLLNVEVTGPYGHDGAYATLEGIVRHHLDPEQAVNRFDLSQLDDSIPVANMKENTGKALAQIDLVRSMGLTTVEPANLTDREVGYLVTFLETLTDPCVKDAACLAPWMPAEGESDPDGLRVVATFAPME
jgi:cytochrome c peroxidase